MLVPVPARNAKVMHFARKQKLLLSVEYKRVLSKRTDEGLIFLFFHDIFPFDSRRLAARSLPCCALTCYWINCKSLSIAYDIIGTGFNFGEYQ